jgi:hypothetical protein
MEKLKIGEAAKLLGINEQTLRNWDKLGKFQSEKTRSGHRLYDRKNVEEMKNKITRALKEIKTLKCSHNSKNYQIKLYEEHRLNQVLHYRVYVFLDGDRIKMRSYSVDFENNTNILSQGSKLGYEWLIEAAKSDIKSGLFE